MLAILAAALIASLIPVAAAAKPKPPPPTEYPACLFTADGTLQGYSGGNYLCTWRPTLPSTWTITVTPKVVAYQVAFTVKDNHPGDLCGPKPTQGGPLFEPISGVFTLPENGDCLDESSPDYETGDPQEFYLWVSATVRQTNTVTVTVLPQQ